MKWAFGYSVTRLCSFVSLSRSLSWHCFLWLALAACWFQTVHSHQGASRLFSTSVGVLRLPALRLRSISVLCLSIAQAVTWLFSQSSKSIICLFWEYVLSSPGWPQFNIQLCGFQSFLHTLMWWHTPFFLVLRRQGQVDLGEFQDSLGYIGRPCLKKILQHKNLYNKDWARSWSNRSVVKQLFF